MDLSRIRNFCIIAHIDHGKSTLADRLLQITHTISDREMQAQVLDTMDLEREKGVTIKASAVRMEYTASDGITYEMNLIDTPGHVDFGYEVSRALLSCEGAILVVDATQGVEAQTLANLYLALEADLELVPVVNKIDLPAALPEDVAEEVEHLIGIDAADVIPISAKMGTNVERILEAVVHRVPPPSSTPGAPLRALVFDSHYDSYKGVIAYVRVFDGILRDRQAIRMMANGVEVEPIELGVFRPGMVPVKELTAGEVGYIATGLKTVRECRVGDTITLASQPAGSPLPGYQMVKPMVFAGFYPSENDDYHLLKEALEKLQLNDASLVFEPETSNALNFGFRCGFLGLFHMEIIQERLEREFDLDLIATAPSVVYRLTMTNGDVLELHNPADMPDVVKIEQIEEPWIRATIMTPDEHLGAILKLCEERRGEQVELTYAGSRAMLTYDLPLNEVVFDFYDRLKSVSRGYASFDYQITGYRAGDLVKMSILVNGEPVDALSVMVHRAQSERRGRAMCEKLKDLIPRHLFKIPIQAAIGGKVIARETIAALRKDVTAKCYGGDATRKRKLLEKQKEGKKRMRQFGKVDIPQEAFINALKMDG